MAKAKTKKRRATRVSAADSEIASGVAGLLESLLAKSQAEAARLSDLLEHSEKITDDRRQRPERRAETAPSRIEQLETARAVAEAADKAKSCFLAAMSRELRTPVDGLARMIELLQHTDIDDEQRRYLRTASQSVCALLSLLDSVLTLSKVDAGVIDLRTTDFELRRIVDDAVGLAMPVAGRKGLQLTAEVRPEIPSLLRGEPGRIRQILLYAIRRATQLTERGEIALDVAVESSLQSATTVRFTIRHTETDLSPEEFHRSFAPHSHIENLTADSRGGRGLGLAIARHIVELMGGRIELEANNGRGFTLWFTIPLDNYRQAADERRAHGRLPQELLQSSLGPVLDLSIGGMRVHCNRAPKGRIDVQLLDMENPFTIRANVMWTRRIRFRKYEVGLAFPHVPPDIAKQLTRVSLNHRLRRLLGL